MSKPKDEVKNIHKNGIWFGTDYTIVVGSTSRTNGYY